MIPLLLFQITAVLASVEECYICYEEKAAEQCVRACDFCRRSNVHLSCLLQHHNINEALSPKCPTCKNELGPQFCVVFYTELLEQEDEQNNSEISYYLEKLGNAY